MIFAGIKTAFNVAKNWTIKHSPEILLGTSIAAGIGATVTGCIATTKMEAINQKHKEILDILHERGEMKTLDEDDVVYKETKEYKSQVTKEYGRYWFDIAKTWAPCVGLTLLSGTAALGSFKIVNKRLLVAETAFTGVAKAFEQYRDNVIEDQGYEKDEYYANNGALKKKQELIAKGKYKQKELPVSQDPTIKCLDLTRVDDIFHYYFNEDTVKTCCYSSYPYYNMRLLSQTQEMFDNRLKSDGIVFLDDIYQYLGLDMKSLLAERSQGRTYGWVLDCFTEDGMPNDQHVLFGLFEYNDTQHRLFRAGQINDVMLHFNCRLLTPETCAKFARG